MQDLYNKLAFVFDTNPVTISEITVFSDGSQHVEERSYSAEAVEIFEMGYYLLTGTTPEREGWIPRIHSKDQYDSVVDQCCKGDSRLKRALGFCCLDNPDGLELIIRGDRPISDVILTLAHEAGHTRQKITNPTQSEAGNDTNIGAIREAEAYAFEVALVRALGEYTRLNVSRFPDIPAVRSFLDDWAVFIREKRQRCYPRTRQSALLPVVGRVDRPGTRRRQDPIRDPRCLDVVV